jgi:hypothetical protein
VRRILTPRKARACGLFVLLCAGAATAAADWTPVTPDNGIFASYADKSTIARDGAYATMRGMYDFPKGDLTPQGKPLFSSVVEREYDCAARKVRLLAYEDRGGRLGEGHVVDAARRSRPWQDVVEGSVDAAFWRVACGAI